MTKVHIEDIKGNKKTIVVHGMINLINIIREASKTTEFLINQDDLYFYKDEGKYFCYDILTETTFEITDEEFEFANGKKNYNES